MIIALILSNLLFLTSLTVHCGGGFQHGLQNYPSVRLGDNRLRLEKSFSHEVFHPKIPRSDPDKGLSEEHIMANRRRDYNYVR